MMPANVYSWPEADLPSHLSDVCFRGDERTRAKQAAEVSSWTQTGHWVAASRVDRLAFLTRRPVAKC